jgi:hypothetical protein
VKNAAGQYRLDRLIMRYGIDAKLFEWSDEITADFPRKHSGNLRPVRRTVPGPAKSGVAFEIIAPNSRARHDALVPGGGLTQAPD